MTKRQQVQNPPKHDIGIAILAGDAFFAHSEAFTKEWFGKDINPAPQLTGQFISTLIASATTLALGIELYLKALRMQAGLPIPKTHHLLSLYTDLPQEMTTAIEDQYERTKPSLPIGKAVGFELVLECGSVPPEVITQWEDKKRKPPDHSLKALLERSSDAFNTWRYLHEVGREGELMIYSYEYGGLTAVAKSLRTILGPVGFISRDRRPNTR